jgi:hypothetical protein
MEYQGRVQVGDDAERIEAVVRIPDAESPEWFGQVTDGSRLPPGEVAVVLLDSGIYNAWQGTALVRHDDDGQTILTGLHPLEPPVGG